MHVLNLRVPNFNELRKIDHMSTSIVAPAVAIIGPFY